MKIEFKLSEVELKDKIDEILMLLIPHKIWLLEGEMGSGKTTLVNAFAARLGDTMEASSPSYTLINEYYFKKNSYQIERLYHLDLYRLRNLEEVMDIGIEDIVFGKDICIIEWPQIVLPLLKDENTVYLKIERLKNDKRKYQIVKSN